MDSSKLIELLSPYNFWKETPFTGFERGDYLNELERLVLTGQVVLVSGVRRAGKTTLLLQFLKRLIERKKVNASQTLYVNLEDPRLPQIEAARLLDSLLVAHKAHVDNSGPDYLILDEVQRLEGWERWVRVINDTRPELKVLLSGSSAHLLSRELATLLTGRHLDLEVFPLSLAEYGIFKGFDPSTSNYEAENWQALAQEYLRASAFPQVVTMEDDDLAERMVQQIYRDILNHDVARRYRLRDVEKLEALANQLLASVPGPVTFNALKRALQGRMALDTVERYCTFLAEPYLFQFVQTHAFSSAARERSPRKVYAIDNGLLLACSYRFTAETGKLLENAVFNDLRRQQHQIFRWKDKRELDFLIWQGNEPLALINVSTAIDNPATRQRELEGLQAAMTAFDLPESWLVTLDTTDQIELTEGLVRVVDYRRWALEHVQELGRR